MERKDFLNTFFKPSNHKKKQFESSEKKNKSAELQPPFTGGINPYSGSWTDNEVIHLLKRLTYGAPPQEVAYFKSLTYTQAVEELINTTSTQQEIGEPLKFYTPDTATVPASDPDWSVPMGSTWVNTITYTSNVNRGRRESLKIWWLNNMVNQKRSIEEKMILFWSSHVAIEISSIGGGLMSYQYLQLLRTHALGNFKTLIKDIVINPGMLYYLNGNVNTKTAPDENLGRELQELFTLGKGPDSQYTEDDVKAAARVLTGHQVNLDAAIYSFAQSKHDTNPKQFSSFYNNTIINRSATEGQQETDDLVEMIFAKDEVSKNICRRLYRYFVYHNITADTEATIITPLAQTLRDNNYNVKPVLEQLFKSEHFFDVLQFGDTIKSPLDFTVGLIRECGVKLPPASNSQLLYKHLSYLATTFLPAIEQNILDPNNVSGFLAYYQPPFFDKLWVNTDTFIRRKSFVETLIGSGYSAGGFKTIINPIKVASLMSNPGNPNDLVRDFNKYFLRRQLSDELLRIITVDVLLTGQNDDTYWTSAWNAYINEPANLEYFSVVNTRLKSLLTYFFSRLEEYHLM